MKVAVVLACVAGCTVDRTVLEGEITNCGDAMYGVNGQPCSFDLTCSNPTDCCNNTEYCADGHLVVDQTCNPDCSICVDDSQCTHGAAICLNNRCVPCASACPIAVCPLGWNHLPRNGCPTCECAPPATCISPGMPCAAGVCYRGALCASGCISTDPACCSNQCEAMGCTTPVPTGCLMVCPAALAGMCSTCAADHCQCDVTGSWTCTAICADGANASCVAP